MGFQSQGEIGLESSKFQSLSGHRHLKSRPTLRERRLFSYANEGCHKIISLRWLFTSEDQEIGSETFFSIELITIILTYLWFKHIYISEDWVDPSNKYI